MAAPIPAPLVFVAARGRRYGFWLPHRNRLSRIPHPPVQQSQPMVLVSPFRTPRQSKARNWSARQPHLWTVPERSRKRFSSALKYANGLEYGSLSMSLPRGLYVVVRFYIAGMGRSGSFPRLARG